MLFMLSSISPFLVRKVRLLMDCLHRRRASPPAPLQNRERGTKPHPQPLPEEGGEWLAMEMEEVILGLFRGGDVVDNKG